LNLWALGLELRALGLELWAGCDHPRALGGRLREERRAAFIRGGRADGGILGRAESGLFRTLGLDLGARGGDLRTGGLIGRALGGDG